MEPLEVGQDLGCRQRMVLNGKFRVHDRRELHRVGFAELFDRIVDLLGAAVPMRDVEAQHRFRMLQDWPVRRHERSRPQGFEPLQTVQVVLQVALARINGNGPDPRHHVSRDHDSAVFIVQHQMAGRMTRRVERPHRPASARENLVVLDRDLHRHRAGEQVDRDRMRRDRHRVADLGKPLLQIERPGHMVVVMVREKEPFQLLASGDPAPENFEQAGLLVFPRRRRIHHRDSALPQHPRVGVGRWRKRGRANVNDVDAWVGWGHGAGGNIELGPRR